MSAEFQSPVSVIVLCHGGRAECEPLAEGLRQTLLGIDPQEKYPASDRELLDPMDFRVFYPPKKAEEDSMVNLKPEEKAKKCLLEQSRAVLIVLLLARDDQNAKKLANDWLRVAETKGKGNRWLLKVSLVEPEKGTDEPREVGQPVTRLNPNELKEPHLYQAILSLHALHRALRLLQLTEGAQLRIFISHAKSDGVALARSVQWWADEVKLESFYDNSNLRLDPKKSINEQAGQIEEQLKENVEGSLFVVLRTEALDERYWCRKEMYWAEKYGVPVVAVDGRWSLQHTPSVLNFDSSPAVRIPDGSVVRILLAVLGEALRVQLFRARVKAVADAQGVVLYETLPRSPSLTSLHEAVRRLKGKRNGSDSKPLYVVYPNPMLPTELRNVVGEIGSALCEGIRVLSLDEFRPSQGLAAVNPVLPLHDRSIGISISDPGDLESLGLDKDAVNLLSVSLARRIIALGGSVVFGHRWASGGVMEAVSRFALAYAAQSGETGPLIKDFVAEPDRSGLSETQKKALKGIIDTRSQKWKDSTPKVPRSSTFGTSGLAALRLRVEVGDSEQRSRNLTALRRKLAKESDVRIAIGGKREGSKGFAPGVLEESWWQLAVGKQKRLVICTGMKGAAQTLANAGRGEIGKFQEDGSLQKKRPLLVPYLTDFVELRQSGANWNTSCHVVKHLSVDAILAGLLKMLPEKSV